MIYPNPVTEEAFLDESEYDHAKDHLIGLVEDIYKTGSLEDLEFHLEEILVVFGLKIPKSQPVLMSTTQNKKQKYECILKGWVDFSRAYAKELCNSKK